VLPVTVRELERLDIVRPPVKVVRPLLLMVTRSMSWVLAVALVLPVELVLKIRLPPRLPVESCNASQAAFDREVTP